MKKLIFTLIVSALSLNVVASDRYAILGSVDTQNETLARVRIKMSHVKGSVETSFKCSNGHGEFIFQYPILTLNAQNSQSEELSYVSTPVHMDSFFLMDQSSDERYVLNMHSGLMVENEFDEIPEIKRDGMAVNGFVCSKL